MTIKATTTKTTTFHGRCFWPLSYQRRSYNYCTRKMNGDVRLLKRGASVAQLQSPSRFQPEPIPMLAFEELSFAENFTTSSRTNLPKIIEVIQVDSVYDTIKQVIELRDRSISSLTLERLVKKFCQAYENLDPQQKQDVLLHLASKYYIKEEDLKGKAAEIVHTKEYEILMKKEQELRTILDPPYNWLFSKLAQIQQNGVKFLGDIRADVLTVLLESKTLPNDQRLALKTMSGHLKELLTHWFSAGLLELEQVTWQSSCSMLQKISEYEAVHPVKSWADIKSRVGPYRRCFVFTHRSMPGEPIVVLHVALTTDISASIASVVKHHRGRVLVSATSIESEDLNESANLIRKGSENTEDPALCTTAIFYSITSTQTGLQGIELGNSLIKLAVKKLREEFPTMNAFSTLSPVPGFRNWLLKTLQMSKSNLNEIITDDEKARISLAFYGPTDNFFDSLFTALKTNQWAQNEKLRSALETPLMRLCAKYLYLEKRRNFALDPVANFHLRNGAAMWRINWWADLSPRGLTNSCGIMVNYRYYLDKLEDNSTKYQETKTVEASEQVKVLAMQAKLEAKKPSQL